jgi:hypothetical protein
MGRAILSARYPATEDKSDDDARERERRRGPGPGGERARGEEKTAPTRGRRVFAVAVERARGGV